MTDKTTSTETQYWAVGHNMPGYLPESDVWVTDSWESAKGSLIDDMERAADSDDSYARSCETGQYPDATEAERAHAEAEQLSAACEDLNLLSRPQEWDTIIGNTSWWIMVSDEAPKDDDETDLFDGNLPGRMR